jgi:two-component system, NarL family, sensor histidine kinase LiaS
MNPGKYAAMDATISIPTFGHRNNWFSDRLNHLSPNSFKVIVLLLGISVFTSFTLLVVSQHQAQQTITTSLEQMHTLSGIVQQSFDARLQIEHFFASGDPEDYRSGEQQMTQVVNALEQYIKTSEAVDYFMLSRLEQTSSDYLNTFRSLGSLTFGGAADNTQQAIREELASIGSALDTQTQAALQQNMAVMDQHLPGLANSITVIGVAQLFVLSSVFSISLIVVLAITRRSTYALHQIRRAVQQMTSEQYDTHIDLSGETNPDIIQLGTALNVMAENLRKALRSESAAQKQNYLQIMKLARQERKTAVLEERQRIAHELHDSVKQQLFSITLSAGAAMNLLEHAPDHARTYLEHIRQAGHNAQTEMTALLQELIPVSMQDKRLEDALIAYLNPLCDIHNLKLLWRVVGTNTLTIAQEHALFRAVQEAVSNVVRHSGATILHVSLNFGLVTYVIIEDNGEGFVPEAVPATSTGLSLMRSRLRGVGGRCEIQTTPGMGTRLTILIDLRRAALR